MRIKPIKNFTLSPLAPFFLLSFALWLYLFRGYLSGSLKIIGDAQSYYEHIRFYIENLAQGVYPMWDPWWYGGSPNEFFLRRFGSFNPLYSVLVLLSRFMPSLNAFVLFMALYYFLGMIGFYLCSLLILKDKKTAFLCYVLLLFSSLGTRIFDSYIILLFTPTIWFFYFLISFSTHPRRLSLLGLSFCLMIILTTYLPFYFITLLGVFGLCFGLIYYDHLAGVLRSTWTFFNRHKLFSLFCIFSICVSILPGLLFYQSAADGQFIMPLRNEETLTDTASFEKNSLTVTAQRLGQGGVVLPFIIQELWAPLASFKLERFYIPPFALVLFCLGVLTRVNRRIVFLSLWGFGVYLIACNDATPFYQWLYDHLFFFKLFRNFMFFQWVFLLPLFILLLAVQYRSLETSSLLSGRARPVFLVLVASVHLAAGWFLFSRGNHHPSTIATLALSCLFFVTLFPRKSPPAITHQRFSQPPLLCFRRKQGGGNYILSYTVKNSSRPTSLVLACYILLAFLGPLEAYHHLARNSLKQKLVTAYDDNVTPFSWNTEDRLLLTKTIKDDIRYEHIRRFYFVSRWFDELFQKIPDETFNAYKAKKLLVYENVEYITDASVDFKKLERALSENKNLAFITSPPPASQSLQDVIPGSKAEILGPASEHVKLLSYNANFLRLKTNYPARKFLVFNDNFHSEWQAMINKQPVTIDRANIAFKGVWLPAGENVLEFNFGSRQRKTLNAGLLLLFYGIFVYLIALAVRETVV